MSISVNGQSQVPPGFRFHPTEEELLQYYLRKKVALEKIDLDVIQDVDLNKLEPWDIQEKCKIGSTTSTPQNDWYFFSHKDKKYPTGTRTNRATVAGFWKATGRDKVIYSNSKRIGMRKTLVFYKGRAPHGQKSDWIMHEYRRLVEYHDNDANTSINSNVMMQEEGWVVCRVFKKKNHFHISKSRPGSIIATSSVPIINCQEEQEEGTLEQMLQYIGNTNNYPFRRRSNNNINDIDHNQYLEEEIHNEDDDKQRRFFKLPSLEESPPNSSTSHIQINYQPIHHISGGGGGENNNNHKGSTSVFYDDDESSRCRDWASLDRLVASHLNCPVVNVLQSDQDQIKLPSYNSSSTAAANQINIHDDSCDLWSFNCS
ncbi:hypothetical protein RD792_004497 [Penstemon davidsonii]|uniref:NAC domain-containing protein n=1 Tax=Penstemon davidsonii TaxID=160366 RepID=A0ABR0DHJ8_9LAMI|nr:hypothetical protein RD792_004497 [Penstemon davidsonii]